MADIKTATNNQFQMLAQMNAMLALKHQMQKFILEYSLNHKKASQTTVGKACLKKFKPILQQHPILKKYLSQVEPVLKLAQINDFSQLNNDVLNNYLVRSLKPLNHQNFHYGETINQLATHYKDLQRISSSIQFKIHDEDKYAHDLENIMQKHPDLNPEYQANKTLTSKISSKTKRLSVIVQNCKKLIFIELSKYIQEQYYSFQSQPIIKQPN